MSAMMINDIKWFLKKYTVMILAIFLFHTLFCVKTINVDYNRWNTMSVYFMGYDKVNVHLFRYLFYQFPLWLLCLAFIREKIMNLTVYAVIKLRSVRKWIWVLVIDCIIFTMVFYIAAFLMTFGTISVLEGEKENLFQLMLPQFSNNYNLFVQFLNIIIMSLTMILLSIILWLVMKNGAASFTVILIVHILCVIFTERFPGLGKFLPTVQGMILLQDDLHFTKSFASIYGLAVLVLCLVVLFHLIVIQFEMIVQNSMDEKE